MSVQQLFILLVSARYGFREAQCRPLPAGFLREWTHLYGDPRCYYIPRRVTDFPVTTHTRQEKQEHDELHEQLSTIYRGWVTFLNFF